MLWVWKGQNLHLEMIEMLAGGWRLGVRRGYLRDVVTGAHPLLGVERIRVEWLSYSIELLMMLMFEWALWYCLN